MVKQLLPAQDDFVFNEHKHPAIIGGLGSGKSEAGITRIVKLMIEDPSADFAYYMPTFDLVKLRAIPGFEEFFQNANIDYTINKSEHIIYVSGFGKIIFRSYDNPGRIIAYEVTHSIVDEIDTLKKEDAEVVWRKISERNRKRGVLPNSIGCVTTPDGGVSGFVYYKWGQAEPDSDYKLIRARTYDNPFLPEDYVEQIKRNYDPLLAEMYLNGEFVSLNQNKVYHYFDRFSHHTDRIIHDKEPLHIGIDFNIGGSVAVVLIREGSNLIAVDEFVSNDTYDIVNNLSRYKGHMITLYPDSSGYARSTNASRSDIQILQDAGFMVNAPSQNGAVRDRVNSVNALLSKERLMVNTHRCPKLTHSLESQGYTDKGEPEKFNDHKGGAIDDWNDGLGYPVVRIYPVVRSDYTTSNYSY